jgi:CMP-N-acetylneuraminic acid synthetase
MKFKNIAIIPARGGSKRLPGKNLADFGEKPLIVHSIEYALANKDIIDRIVVSTDSDEIKKTALNYGVEVIERPEQYSHDLSPTWEAVKHVIEKTGKNWDNIFVLQPSNPLRPLDLLKKAYNKFLNSDRKCLFTVSSSDRKFGRINNENYQPYNYKFGERSQDMKPLFFENGLLYITKQSLVMEKNCLIDNDNTVYLTDHPFARIDIDTKEDLLYAEFLLGKFAV